MSAQTNEQITELDRELIRLAQAGDIKGFVEAMLEHPVDGRLMRAFALEEDAPEYEECMKRIQEKFGAPPDVQDSQESREDGSRNGRDRSGVAGRDTSTAR